MSDERLPLSEEECRFLSSIMNKKYSGKIGDRSFELSSDADENGIYAEVLLRNVSGTFYYPVEGRISTADHEMSVRDASIFLVDYIDCYFEEFLKDETYLPIDWSAYECEGVRIELRGQIINRKLEAMADELLNQSSQSSS